MNAWNEPYPKDMDLLMSDCKAATEVIRKVLREKTCISISDLYQFDDTSLRVRTTKEGKEVLKKYINNRKSSTDKKENEIKGLYVLAISEKKNITPVYAGISGTIFRRLKQHSWGKQHNEASLAYLMARKEIGHKASREKLESVELLKQQEVIRNCFVVIYPEKDDFKLYFLEAYVAGALRTKWNRFKTH